VRRVAQAWDELMQRLGYRRYGAQGGDWGASISRELGLIVPEHLVGVHLNMLFPQGPDDVADLTDEEQARLRALRQFRTEGMGYGAIQSTRPQTLAYGLTDSPAGQLAWLYWLTGTAGSSARLYYEAAHSGTRGPPVTSTAPTGVAVFPREIAPPIRRFAELSNNIVHWAEFDRGGHFAAMEAPDLLVGDVREFFRPLR
jgi:microsomal epoxide hydrolase